MKFTDIKPNPKDYSREDIVKAYQDRYRYTGQLTKLIQTPVKIPYYHFSKEPYLIFDPKIQTVTEESINVLLDTENISDNTLQDIICNTSFPVFDKLIEHLNIHYLKEQLGDTYNYIKYFDYPYIQDALANCLASDQKPLNTRLFYLRFNRDVNPYRIHIFSQNNHHNINPSSSNITLKPADDDYLIMTQDDSLIAINNTVVNTLIPDLKQDLKTIKNYVNNHPKQLTKTVNVTDIPEDYHKYLKDIDKLKITFPTNLYDADHGPHWLSIYRGNPITETLKVTLKITDNQLSITHDFKPEESLIPFTHLTANSKEANTAIYKQLQNAFKTAYFHDQCDSINQNDAIDTYLAKLDRDVGFKDGSTTYNLFVEYAGSTKIIDYYESGLPILRLQRDKDYGKHWDIKYCRKDSNLLRTIKDIETFKSLF
jgi:hypothetical protein